MDVVEPLASRIDELAKDAGEILANRVDALADDVLAWAAAGALPGTTVVRPHPLLVLVSRPGGSVLLVPAEVWDRGRSLVEPFARIVAEGGAMLLVVGRPKRADLERAQALGVASFLPDGPTAEELGLALARAMEILEVKAKSLAHERSALRYDFELDELVGIARAITTERDVDKLLGLILEKSRYITGADAGSIYVLEGEEDSPTLRFKLTQNDSVSFDSREFTMPVSDRSIAGSAALHKRTINLADVYDLPPGTTFGFDGRFDDRIGYRTKSMLVVPLVSQRDETIGVIQLINRKRDPAARLPTRRDVDAKVVPFDEHSEELVGTLAAQASASLETALLYEEIRKLFEGFVNASVEAIEARDPTTSGHSRRVSNLTLGLARLVDGETTGPYREATFSAGDLRELEYASLLHDFGKIGVRERVLVKAKKLYDERLELIRSRFDFMVRSLEADVYARKISAVERAGTPAAAADVLRALDEELASRTRHVDEAFAAIVAANEPTVLNEGDFARIEALARETFTDLRGEVRPLISPEELAALSVRRGSLTQGEYDEIRSHVMHTFRFLSKIPWGKSLRRVPLIASAHHERPNGTGYPNRWKAEAIPVQSKMMSIADIYDALTASDRPYKKAIPVDRALDILGFEVKDGNLDPELVRIFRESRMWERPY